MTGPWPPAGAVPSGMPWQPAGPPAPSPGPPVMSQSMVVDPGCARRITRSSVIGTERLAALFMIALLPSALVGLAGHHIGLTEGKDGLSGLVTGLIVGAVVYVVLLGLLLAVMYLVVTPRIERMYAAALPVGSTLQVDYYPDRMIATSANGVRRETFYRSIQRVKVSKHCIVWSRGLGAGAFPIEVAPPAAIDLVQRATSGPTGVTR